MKNIKILAVLIALSFVVIGCSEETPDPNDNNNNGNNSTSIVGVWKLDSTDQVNGTMSSSGVVLGSYSAKSENETGSFDFKSDGTVTSVVGYSSVMTISLGGQTITQTIPVPSTSSTANYDYDATGKTLTLVDNLNDTLVYNVVTHTATNMHLSTDFSQTQDVNGMTVQTSATLNIYISK